MPNAPQDEPLKLELRRRWTVEDRHLYNPAGPDGDPKYAVLSSPSMIWEMEITCTELAKSSLAHDKTTVGFHVDVKHVSPAKPGAEIETKAILEKSDDRKLTFSVECREGDRLIGAGKHRRAVVDLDQIV